VKLREKGFTLIELLVALTISGAIVGVMSTAVILIMRTTQQNDEWNMNLRQMQNVGHYISQDALMAQTVSTTTPNVFLHLQWSDWDGNLTTVEYYFNQTNPSTLFRRVNGVNPGILIAEYIVNDGTHSKCTWSAANDTLTLNIRTSLHGNNRFADGTYTVHPRPSIGGG
jgi:prepilin-type N-terminal cleavage/methylation domain-containing protein